MPELTGQFDQWAAFIALEAAFVIAYPRFVPEETRIRYAASCRNLSAAGCILLAHSVWIIAFVQFLIAPAEPTSAQAPIGMALIVVGHALVIWAMRSNPDFVATITPPEQFATGGPYKYLDHPGYTGMSLHSVGLVFLLGQPWALAPMAVYLALLARRCVIEDRLLYRVRNPRTDLQPLRRSQYRWAAELEYGPQPDNIDWGQYAREMSAPRWANFALYVEGKPRAVIRIEELSSAVARFHVSKEPRSISPRELAEVLQWIGDYCFHHGLAELEAVVPFGHRAARRLAIRCGMACRGAIKDGERFSIFREDFYYGRTKAETIQAAI